MYDDYAERKVGRVEPEDNFGIGVSTVWLHDINCFETALKDSLGIYSVERYRTYDEAIEGHQKWVEKSRTISVVKALGLPDWVLGEKISDRWVTLLRYKSCVKK